MSSTQLLRVSGAGVYASGRYMAGTGEGTQEALPTSHEAIQGHIALPGPILTLLGPIWPYGPYIDPIRPYIASWTLYSRLGP